MKIVQINGVCGIGSTGRIAVAISKLLTDKQIENYILYSSESTDYPLGIKFSNRPYQLIQAGISRIFGNDGLNCIWSTHKLIKQLDKISPEIVHIHNIHSHDVNIKMLFVYLKAHPKIKIYYTFHDCWTFTGYCPYFILLKCNAWTCECNHCPYHKKVSWFLDRSLYMYNQKKRALLNQNMEIITPSQWLGDLVKNSFLNEYKVHVVNNGINHDVFKYSKSDFRSRHNVEETEYLVLGVAFDWGIRKGLDVFIRLANDLPENYKILLVGTNENIDKELPRRIISIHRTNNQKELAEIYSSADVFVNPTREENFPTVNIESLACGTPIITFNTGGSPEIINDSCGIVIDVDDIENMKKQIKNVCENKLFTKDACIERSKKYDEQTAYNKYLDIYTGGR